jgi:hypothetical protein
MVKAEHWTSDDYASHTLLPVGSDLRAVLDGTPVFHCTVTGETWEDCLRAYHRHMGWEPWEPINEESRPDGAAGEGDGG